jgi:pSer/pThr/pTyr-binding forkhead associated (FHA) protein
MTELRWDRTVISNGTRKWTKAPIATDLRSYLVQLYPMNSGYGLVEVPVENLLIGRDSICDFVIVDDAVSRRHAIVEWREEGFQLIDYDSSNGTFVNDVRIESHHLQAASAATSSNN